ncbi:MAG: SPASM domain-containing protein [Acidobacteriota bacterium]|nr:SPASM domain-containing protein [Acidobacteriota bacterium]
MHMCPDAPVPEAVVFHECPRDYRFTCDWIFNQLVVLCDGKVVCGCADPYGLRPVGDLERQSLKEIWNSALVRRIRHDLNQGHCCFCDECGLKRILAPGEKPPQREEFQERIPRIFFEPTIQCNLSCFRAVCNRESGIERTRRRLRFPLDAFKRLMDEVGPELIRLDFFNYGDPFMHPQAVDMIEYVKSSYPHVYLYTSTNGLMLTPEKTARLVASGMDEITFSVDGADAETYVKYRCGGDFRRVLQIMSDFVAQRDRTGDEVPFINWRYILFRWNDSQAQMQKARRLAAEIGVDRLTWEITDHPAEAFSRRFQRNSRAWKRIRNEIWDTSQIGNAIAGKRYLARIRPPRGNVAAFAGKETEVAVDIRNTGGALWRDHSRSGRRLVRLGAQLFDRNRRLLDLNYARAFLKRPLSAGMKDRLGIVLPAIEQPGEYWLRFDMVLEGVDWFASAESPVAWRRLRVKA